MAAIIKAIFILLGEFPCTSEDAQCPLTSYRKRLSATAPGFWDRFCHPIMTVETPSEFIAGTLCLMCSSWVTTHKQFLLNCVEVLVTKLGHINKTTL